MDKIKILHQEAEQTLWDLGLKKILIQSKKQTIQNYKPMMVDTDYLEEQIKALDIQVSILKIRYAGQLSELQTLINEL